MAHIKRSIITKNWVGYFICVLHIEHNTEKLKSIQRSTIKIMRSSKIKSSEELGISSLQNWNWMKNKNNNDNIMNK